jgi:hypothetical protein
MQRFETTKVEDGRSQIAAIAVSRRVYITESTLENQFWPQRRVLERQ